MKEYVTYEDNNYLTHWGIAKGGKKEGAKYIARVEENGKYRYFYTQAEYDAYLKGGKEKPTVGEKIANKASQIKKDVSKKTKEVKKDVSKKASDLKDKGENFINNTLKTADKAWNKAVDTASDTYNAGRNYVRDVIGFDERDAMREAASEYNRYNRAKDAGTDRYFRTQKKAEDAKKELTETEAKLETAKREYMSAKGGLEQQKYQKAKREAEGPDFKTKLRNTFNPKAKIAEDKENANKLSSASRKADDAELKYKVAQRNHEKAQKNVTETEKAYESSLQNSRRTFDRLDDAEDRYNSAKTAYDNTILGKVDKVKSNIRVKRRKKKS